MIGYVQAAGAGLVVAAVIVLWALLIYGPSQYKKGGEAKAVEIAAQYDRAKKELGNEATRAEYDLIVCAGHGGVYDFVTGECDQD